MILNFRNGYVSVNKQKEGLLKNMSQNIKLFLESQHMLGNLKTMFILFTFSPCFNTLFTAIG